MGPNPLWLECPYKKGKLKTQTQTCTEGRQCEDSHVMTEVGIGLMQAGAKECQGFLATRSWEDSTLISEGMALPTP